MPDKLPPYISVLDSSFDPVGVFDLNKRYTYFNEKFSEGVAHAYGVNMKIGMSLHDMLGALPKDYELALGYWDRTLAGESFTVTRDFGDAFNRSVFRITFGPIWDETGKIIGGLHWSKNISAEEQKKEEDFRATFDLAAIGLAHTNLKGEWIRVNKALCEITGHTPEELLEKNFLGITHPDDVPLSIDIIEKFMTGKITTFATEKRYFHKLGHFVWVHVTVTMKRKADLTPEYFIVSINSIDKLKKIETALTESEQKFRQLANNIPQIIWTLTPEGANDYYNDRWYEFSGEAPGSLDATVWRRIIHHHDFNNKMSNWLKCFETGTVYAEELRLWDRSSNFYRWFLSRAVPIEDKTGKVTQWVGTLTDINDRKVTSEGLQRILRMRDEFLSIVSHELKTPVTTLSMSAQMLNLFHGEKLAKLTDGDKIVGGIRQIEHQVYRLNHLINDMLDVTRIRSGKLYLNLEELDLSEIIREAVAREDHLSELDLEKIPGLWDRARIEQVITKLLEHASRYSNGKPIRISLRRENSSAIILVLESGTGISKEEIHKIFEPFEGLSYSGQASGIGLFIVKEIVRAHGGSLEVTSVPGTCTEYVLTFPIRSV